LNSPMTSFLNRRVSFDGPGPRLPITLDFIPDASLGTAGSCLYTGRHET
jgi:hypothetical protein